MEPSHINAGKFQQTLERNPSASCMVVACCIVAVSGMAAWNKDSVRALFKCLDNKERVNASCARELYNPYIRLIFHPACACQIRARISAPVADKGYDFGFKIGCLWLCCVW